MKVTVTVVFVSRVNVQTFVFVVMGQPVQLAD
jgi:hypothetical protein